VVVLTCFVIYALCVYVCGCFDKCVGVFGNMYFLYLLCFFIVCTVFLYCFVYVYLFFFRLSVLA